VTQYYFADYFSSFIITQNSLVGINNIAIFPILSQSIPIQLSHFSFPFKLPAPSGEEEAQRDPAGDGNRVQKAGDAENPSMDDRQQQQNLCDSPGGTGGTRDVCQQDLDPGTDFRQIAIVCSHPPSSCQYTLTRRETSEVDPEYQ
jgi:hypothetical protein